MENTSENISVKNMNDDILDAVLKVVKVDIEVNNEVRTAIGNLNGEFEHLYGMVNNRFEAAGKRVKDNVNDRFKKKINDEGLGKKMESLTNTVKDLRTVNSKLKAEIISVRHGVDNCKAGVNAIKGPLSKEVKEEKEKDLVEIKIEQSQMKRDFNFQEK